MIPSYISKLINIFKAAGYKAYVAGGAVRDIVMEKLPHDYDLAVSSLPSETVEILKAAGINYFDNSAKHGTVSAVLEEGVCELTTFRIDGEYEDNRHPSEVSFTRRIEDDVLRRDFTMNSLYMDADSKIIDLTGGMADISARVIRAVGDPIQRFNEDALRILRAVRFRARLGFTIEEKTFAAMKECAPLLKNISGERVYAELKQILSSPFGADAVRENVDVLAVVLPELKALEGFDQHSKWHYLDALEHTLAVLKKVNELAPDDEVLAFAALLHDIGKPEVFVMDEEGKGHMKKHELKSVEIAARFLSELHVSSDFYADTLELIRVHDSYPEPSRANVARMLTRYDDVFLDRLEKLQIADILAHSNQAADRMENLNARRAIRDELLSAPFCRSISDLAVTGSDLLEAGVPKGPEVGNILKELLRCVSEENFPNNRNNLLEKINKLREKC